MSIQKDMSKLSEKDLHSLIINLRQELNDKDSELDKLYGTLKDVSKMVQDVIKTDYQIRDSKQELEVIFDATDDYVVVLDKEHLIRRVNGHFCDLVGKKHKYVLGTAFVDYFPDLPENFLFKDFKEDKFVLTEFFSKKYDKYLIVKSRKLDQSKEPLVYVHITKEKKERK